MREAEIDIGVTPCYWPMEVGPTDCPQLTGSFTNTGAGAQRNPPGHTIALDGALRWIAEPARDEQIRLRLRCFEGAVLVESVDAAHLSMLADGALLLKELRTWRNFGSVFRKKSDPDNPEPVVSIRPAP